MTELMVALAWGLGAIPAKAICMLS